MQYAVLEVITRVYGKTENLTPCKYKMDKDIQMPVAKLSCAQSEQNRLTQFCWKNGKFEFFTHTHTGNQSVKQILSSRLHITNMEGSETLMAQNARFHAQLCLFGINKSCLGVQIPQKPIFGDHSMQNLL